MRNDMNNTLPQARAAIAAALENSKQATGVHAQPDGILTPIPLVEPVYIGKALLAHCEARVVLSGGVGPVAAVHLVNIGLTGWCYTDETATAYAEGYNTALKQYRGALANRATIYAPAPQHPDDIAVDSFAAIMKAKMAKQRAKGYAGWDQIAQCTDKSLADKLMQHTKKGDPVDVANFAMMLHQRNLEHSEIAILNLHGASIDFARSVASMWKLSPPRDQYPVATKTSSGITFSPMIMQLPDGTGLYAGEAPTVEHSAVGENPASEDNLRAEFERQHNGRNLARHRLRGTYSSAPIAALWNQHKRTAEWCITSNKSPEK